MEGKESTRYRVSDVEIDPKKVELYASQGLTVKQIADCLGIARSTFYKYKKESKDITDALKRGRSKGIQEVTNALFDSAVGGNVTAQIFFLKNRDPDKWKDRKDSTINKTVRHSYDDAVLELTNGVSATDIRSAEPTTH